jgi:ComF family protein
VCDECLAEIRPVRASLCLVCGERLAPAQVLMGDGHCVNCRKLEPEFSRAVSYGEYEGSLRGLIHLLKYEGVVPAAPVLGELLADAISELLPDCGNSAVIVPVPLHANKRRARGFNQAERLARYAVKYLPRKLELAPQVLVRQRATDSQVGLTREQRLENLRGAFHVERPALIRGRKVIVVDDVMTTGTTVSECARVLKHAGAERVWAATVARTFHSVSVRIAADDTEGETDEAMLSMASF